MIASPFPQLLFNVRYVRFRNYMNIIAIYHWSEVIPFVRLFFVNSHEDRVVQYEVSEVTDGVRQGHLPISVISTKALQDGSLVTQCGQGFNTLRRGKVANLKV